MCGIAGLFTASSLSGLLLLLGIWVAGIDKVVNNLSQFSPWILAGMVLKKLLKFA
jgi:hypothetical protein